MKIWRLNVIEWIVFILALLIILLFVHMFTCSPSLQTYIDQKKDYLDWESYSTVYDSIENGDLILMSGSTKGEKLCCWFTDSVFSHVGLLFREKNEEGKSIVYILDADLGQGYREGPRISILQEKLERFKGVKYAAIKKLRVDAYRKRPTSTDIISIFDSYSELDFDHLMATWLVADYSWLYKLMKKESEVFCGEMVAVVLQKLGILNTDRVPAWYVPRDFHRPEKRLRLQPGYSYDSTVFFSIPNKD